MTKTLFLHKISRGCLFLYRLQSCPILPHCDGPLRAVNGPYVLHEPSLLLTVRMLSTYGACISLLHEGTMRYGSFDPYGPKTYGACISLLHQGTMQYVSNWHALFIFLSHSLAVHSGMEWDTACRPTNDPFWAFLSRGAQEPVQPPNNICLV